MTTRTQQGQTASATEDKTGQVLIRTGFRRRVIALDAGFTEQSFRLRGDFLYADHLSTGVATIKLNNTSEDPLPFTAQSMIEDWPIEDVMLSAPPQPGLVLNLWYGWKGRIRPPQSVVQLQGGVSILQTATGVPQGADQATSNNNSFHWEQTSGAVAAQFSYIQLYNPAASGKRLYLDAVTSLKVGTAAVYFKGAHDTGQFGGGVSGISRKNGQQTSVGKVGAANLAVDPGTVVVQFVPLSETFVDTPQRYVFNPPIILDQGIGYDFKVQAVNLAFDTLLEWREY